MHLSMRTISTSEQRGHPKTKLKPGIWVLLVTTLAGPCVKGQSHALDFNVPDGLRECMAPVRHIYDFSSRINPFYLRGDFDGDGKPDFAVLIVSKSHHEDGIAMCLSSLHKVEIVGAGVEFYKWRNKTFGFFDAWQVYAKSSVQQGVGEGPPPKLVGEAILLEKTEAASGLLYWDGNRFLWYQQGD